MSSPAHSVVVVRSGPGAARTGRFVGNGVQVRLVLGGVWLTLDVRTARICPGD
ncbi:MAG: hypothetical protein ACKOYM_05915 [Actinomycetes bacterium]